MEIEILNSGSSFSGESRFMNYPLNTFEIPVLIKGMKQSSSWENGELNSIILLRSPGRKIVLTALHEGTEIVSFQTGDPVTIQVVEGKLKFQNQEESVTLLKNQLLTITEKMKFRLTSLEETVFLLTILKESYCLSEHGAGVN